MPGTNRSGCARGFSRAGASESDMADSVATSSARRHVVLPDVKPSMLKADVRNPDVKWLEGIGQAIARAISVCGWSHKEAAAKVAVDDAEFGKWLSGTRRPQFDKLFAVEALRAPLVIAIAELAGVPMETVIRIQR